LLLKEFCCIVRYIEHFSEGVSPIRDESNVVIRPDYRIDNTVILIYIHVITSELNLPKLVNYYSHKLFLWEAEPVFRVVILIVVCGIVMLLIFASNIVRILV
jgi:hypothetical protein